MIFSELVFTIEQLLFTNTRAALKESAAWLHKNVLVNLYDNEITSLIDIYFLQISFIPSDPIRYFIYVTYSTDK